MEKDIAIDLAAVSQISAIPTILEVICQTTGLGFAAVARVTETQWTACAVRDEINFGLLVGGELDLKTTICDDIRQNCKMVVIDHASQDEVYSQHHTPLIYGFESYISVPIILQNGTFFGTLCAIDPKPASVKNEKTIGMFKLFSELIAFHLNAHYRIASSEAELLVEQNLSKIKEEFIAVLGHDIQNPLNSIQAGCILLEQSPLNSKQTKITKLMKGSVSRAVAIVNNVKDFTRSRLGGGLTINGLPDVFLENTLMQIVDEQQSIFPSRILEYEFQLNQPVHCDPHRIGQLFSNLVSNALIHGSKDSSVGIKASTDNRLFRLSVINSGAIIPQNVQAHLFEAFSKGGHDEKKTGLGLGLYIASEIAKAHGGTLQVHSSAEETRFDFKMPTHP